MQAIRQSTLALSRRAAFAAPPQARYALFSTSRIAFEESPIKETAQKVHTFVPLCLDACHRSCYGLVLVGC